MSHRISISDNNSYEYVSWIREQVSHKISINASVDTLHFSAARYCSHDNKLAGKVGNILQYNVSGSIYCRACGGVAATGVLEHAALMWW